MRTIKANKTQFYNLLRKYSRYELPALKDTAYEKATRADAYWLRFANKEGQWVIVYLEMFCDCPTMRISCRLDHYDKTITVEEEDVKDMVQEISRGERREHVWTIRWTDNSGIDSCRGTEEEAERYAAEKCRELGKPGYILVE